jgi:hypothetical protein
MNSGIRIRAWRIQLLVETSAEGIVDSSVESGDFRDVRLTLYFDFVEHTFERRGLRWESI